MKSANIRGPDQLVGVTVVSPACLGGEEKNQDRARWHGPSGAACVCDGVSASPYAAQAAGIGTALSPALPGNDPKERITVVADVLVARRLEVLQAPIRIPPGTPPAMVPILQEAAHKRLESAFQTTLIAASFTQTQSDVAVRVVSCGDSAMFVFSQGGDLFFSTLPCADQSLNNQGDSSPEAESLGFQPGAELLVKIICRVSEWPSLIMTAGIQAQYAPRWLACLPLDRCDTPYSDQAIKPDDLLHRQPMGGILLVPSFLVGGTAGKLDGKYCRLRYSKSIRQLSRPTPEPILSARGSVTAVVPDHVYSGRWGYHQDRFPLDAHFLLASDGFYRNFDNAGELWGWLKEYGARLQGAEQAQIMRDLHHRLHRRYSDDDISFVWVRTAALNLRQGEKGEATLLDLGDTDAR